MKATPTPEQPADLAAKVDRCAYLICLEQEAKPWRDELKRLKGELQTHCENLPAELPTRLVGKKYYLDFSAREMQRKITNPAKAFNALKRAIGITRLIEAITITFKLLDQHVDAADQAAYVVKDRTGSRDIEAGVILAPATKIAA